MQVLLHLLSVLYKLYFFLLFVVVILLFYPIEKYFLSKPERFPKAFLVIKIHAKILLFLAGIKIKVSGLENIPTKGPYVICSNHSSFLDPLFIYAIFQDYFTFVGKKEIEKWPIFHIYYTSGMNILVDRKSANGDIKALKRMYQEIDKGIPLTIFPEGTRSKKAPFLEEFKEGAFLVAVKKQVPVVPVTFLTNWKLLQSGGLFKGQARPGIAEIIIHSSQITEGLERKDLASFTAKIHSIIEQPILKKYDRI